MNMSIDVYDLSYVHHLATLAIIKSALTNRKIRIKLHV